VEPFGDEVGGAGVEPFGDEVGGAGVRLNISRTFGDDQPPPGSLFVAFPEEL
jgi:hypothetical protein